MHLEFLFKDLCSRYTNDINLIERLWVELEHVHTQPTRKYHNLDHIMHLIEVLIPVKTKIKNWDTLLFSVFYHDYVYSVTNKMNEENSAEVAIKNLALIQAPQIMIVDCAEQILATKKHLATTNTDINFFIDADLSILGTSEATYKKYLNAVRQEYKLFPNILYNPGRKKILEGILKQDKIFKTTYFYSIFENNARKNLANEIESLV